MRSLRTSFICAQCRVVRPRSTRVIHHPASRLYSNSTSNSNPLADEVSIQRQQRPTIAPRPIVDIKSIRTNPELYAQNCLERNYKAQSAYPGRIKTLFEEWQGHQAQARKLRERSNEIRREIANPASIQHEDEARATEETDDVRTMTKEQLLAEARQLKASLSGIEEAESTIQTTMTELALAIPNTTSPSTPIGTEPEVLSYINEPHPALTSSSSDRIWRSHVHIGSELGILDFAGAAKTSGWGWYYLLDEGAQLEQALIQYVLTAVTRMPGWRQVAPPSLVYSHIAAACGFQPRDTNGETQIYALAQSPDDKSRGKPELSLAGTAEIPLAGMKSDTIMESSELPAKRVGVSRCYRAEAGARGAETKGLYRVHEFTKVEMFAWTAPDHDATEDVFDEMVDIQTEILSSLGLHCRVLEMPSTDLGASAYRKIDIEAFFPSRAAQGLNDGWGEVTSASICTDYQSRRLGTRLRGDGGKGMDFPWTVNGTAIAIPRVLAAVLENGWVEEGGYVDVPECLRPWMDGLERIEMRHKS
ncbi:hypothetical protein GGR57DRAFT_463379 [Xylariaceae sp. FL1272]|nr:hypothetical protein GGR57DRAFT_463379 [Xylariaceae sp. FL1272]